MIACRQVEGSGVSVWDVLRSSNAPNWLNTSISPPSPIQSGKITANNRRRGAINAFFCVCQGLCQLHWHSRKERSSLVFYPANQKLKQGRRTKWVLLLGWLMEDLGGSETKYLHQNSSGGFLWVNHPSNKKRDRNSCNELNVQTCVTVNCVCAVDLSLCAPTCPEGKRSRKKKNRTFRNVWNFATCHTSFKSVFWRSRKCCVDVWGN